MKYCAQYRPSDLPAEFKNSNQRVLKVKRGAGLWLWKPYIILDTLSKLSAGDAVIYCDSGAIVRKDLNPLVDTCRNQTEGILGFDVADGCLERQWTKRSAFVMTGCDTAQYWDSNQIRTGTIVAVKCKESDAFLKNWMKWISNYALSSDAFIPTEKDEFDDFDGHRHDQSLFSLLYKKHGYKSYEDLTGYSINDFIESHVRPEPSIWKLLPTFFEPSLFFRQPRF